jgi:hypothetical protein
MSTDSITIPPDVAAHVLFHYGRDGGYQAGSFTTALLAVMGTADPSNLDRLAAGFPDYVAAVTAIQYDPDGVERLQAIVRGDVVSKESADPQCPEALFSQTPAPCSAASSATTTTGTRPPPVPNGASPPAPRQKFRGEPPRLP